MKTHLIFSQYGPLINIFLHSPAVLFTVNSATFAEKGLAVEMTVGACIHPNKASSDEG